MARSDEYWRDRFEQLEAAQHNVSAEQIAMMQEQFDKAQATISGKINAWYQRFAVNNGVSMAEAKKMLSNQELRELKWNVEDYIKYGKENKVSGAWLKQLENASARVHISRLEALKLEVQQEAEKLFGSYTDSVDSHIRAVYANDFYHTAYEIQKGIGIGSRLYALDDRVVSKIVSKPWAVDGKNFSERIWESKTKLINNVHNSLSRMCITGESPDRAIREVANAMKVSKSQAGRLVMTESAAFANKARQDCMNELDVEEFEFCATLDSITSEVCREMDGKHFPMSEYVIGVTAPPMHPNCRSCTCPYFDDEFTVNEKRAARGEDGKTYYVPADTTYEEWKSAFVDGENKEDLAQMTIPDVKFAIRRGATITAKQQFHDAMTVSSAYNDLPIKVKQNLGDVTFEFGYDGSACDIRNKIIRVGMGASKEEIFHEMGHLIENYMMSSTDARKYKEFLVDGLTYNDIMVKTYYDNAGNDIDIYLLKGKNFESEYQSRLYALDPFEAVNEDGTINVEFLGEAISEVFRKYMNGENISQEARGLIERVIL